MPRRLAGTIWHNRHSDVTAWCGWMSNCLLGHWIPGQMGQMGSLEPVAFAQILAGDGVAGCIVGVGQREFAVEG